MQYMRFDIKITLFEALQYLTHAWTDRHFIQDKAFKLTPFIRHES